VQNACVLIAIDALQCFLNGDDDETVDGRFTLTPPFAYLGFQ